LGPQPNLHLLYATFTSPGEQENRVKKLYPDCKIALNSAIDNVKKYRWAKTMWSQMTEGQVRLRLLTKPPHG
jgi:hypothetical protein